MVRLGRLTNCISRCLVRCMVRWFILVFSRLLDSFLLLTSRLLCSKAKCNFLRFPFLLTLKRRILFLQLHFFRLPCLPRPLLRLLRLYHVYVWVRTEHLGDWETLSLVRDIRFTSEWLGFHKHVAKENKFSLGDRKNCGVGVLYWQ